MTLRNLADLDGPIRFMRWPGPWLWIVLALGMGIRAYLVIFTEGTDDVAIWFSHAGWTRRDGLVGYYEWQEVFNHPPFIGKAISLLWVLARLTEIPFPMLLRAPFALLDLGNAFLLQRLFRRSKFRYAVFAGYWLHPLSIIYSAYHGNTDTAVAFFCLLAVNAAAARRPLASGAALGVGLWVKLSVSLAAPALLFCFVGWRRRLAFGAVLLAVGISTTLPVLLEAPGLVAQRVFAYPGLNITTPGGDPIWTIWSVFGIVDALPETWRSAIASLIDAHAAHNSWVCLLPVVLLAWLRRNERTPGGLGVTVCGSFVLFYAFNNNFLSFQYFAWSIPFWFFPGRGFAWVTTLTVGGYVYAAYVLFCGSPFLLGTWDFRAHPHWPGGLLLWRDLSVLWFFVSAWAFLIVAARREWSRSPGPADPHVLPDKERR
ncbi:MAG: hypothetical protein V3T07_01160 [Myxococcota bacterium]